MKVEFSKAAEPLLATLTEREADEMLGAVMNLLSGPEHELLLKYEIETPSLRITARVYHRAFVIERIEKRT